MTSPSRMREQPAGIGVHRRVSPLGGDVSLLLRIVASIAGAQ
jgi:hypothetical protein